MAIQYRVYANDLAGGPVDYSTPAYDGPLLTFATAPLPFGSDATYAVRAYDTVTGHEERNLSATARVVTGPAGENLSLAPPAVLTVTARAEGPGSLRVAWRDVAERGPRAPAGFRVYAGTPDVSYASPAATVSASAGQSDYATVLTGLSAATPYQVAVRPYNASAEQTAPSRLARAFTGASAPAAPEGGSSSPSPFS